MFGSLGGTAAAADDFSKLPLIGRIGDTCNMIWIERRSQEGKRRAINQIISHAENEQLPKLIVFPQGITSTKKIITAFKNGAFLPGLPVQPVALNYFGNKFHDLSWTFASFVSEFYWAGVQFVNTVNIKVCDKYTPNNKEKDCPQQFAENVRQIIIKKLPNEVTATRHAFEDMLLKKKTPEAINSQRVVMEDVFSKLHFKVNTVTKLADIFATLDLDKDGLIDYGEFCKSFDRDEKEANIKNLFNFFVTEANMKKSEKIGFEKFLTGVAIAYYEDLYQDALKAFFQGIDTDGTGYINKMSFLDVLSRSKKALEDRRSKQNNVNTQTDHGYLDENDVKALLQNIFEGKNEDEKVFFTIFKDRVIDTKISTEIQKFLQFILYVRMGIELTKDELLSSR